MAQYLDPNTGEAIHTGSVMPGGPTSQTQKSQYLDPNTGEPLSGTSEPPNGGQVTGGSSDQPSIMSMAGDVGKGILKGVGSTAYNIGKALYPDVIAKHMTGVVPPEQERQAFAPTNTAQSIGKGAEQIGEFMLPGGLEEEGAAKLATMAPRLGRAAAPLARIATSALSSGAVNAAQGGSPLAGAAMGAGGAIVGQGLKAMAPTIAEGALNIRKLDRAYGKGGGAIGRAVLDETKGIRPGTIAQSAEDRLGELNPQLNAAADRASVRPNPTRGLLAAPPTKIPLHNAPDVEGRLSQPIRLTQVDRPGPPMLQAPSVSTPMASGMQDAFPERLASGDTGIRPTEFGDHPGMGQTQYMGEIPGERGGVGQSQGVLLRAAPAGSGPIPSLLPNRAASLSPARGVLSDAFGAATRQGERTTAGQLQPMATHLGETMSGEAIPENVTPRQLLDLKRGFGNEYIHRWNPETMTGVKGTAARTYHALGQEFNRTVPEAEGLNSRISNLIPVAKRASSEELNAPTMQRAVNRFAAHTGALTGAGIGGAIGYREGGLGGAVAGGLTGVFAPELIASPEGQMVAARLLNKASELKPLVGTAAQFTRKKDEE